MQWNSFQPKVQRFSPEDQEIIHRAFELGKEMHAGQRRKSGEPYFTHCIRVAEILCDMGADVETVVAALLHDTIEDTPLTVGDIRKEFDSNVAALVEGSTKIDEAVFRGYPSLNEQTETLRKIFTFMQQDVRIMIIKIADRLHNMQTIASLSKKRQKELSQETMDVYVKIADRLCMQKVRDQLDELCTGILAPSLLKTLVSIRKQDERTGKKYIPILTDSVKKRHAQLAKKMSIEYENKPWEKRRGQLDLEGESITGVSAFTAVFICPDVQTCYETLGFLHQSWKRETLSFEDFINSPMINGYQGLHTTIILDDGTRVRCKIRTEDMHAYARRGITTKCFDGEAVGLMGYFSWAKHIPTLAEDTAMKSGQFWESLQSDILGESIVIHGPNDTAVAVPRGATALDGALYLFPRRALSLRSIRVDGREVAFSEPLEHAASLDLTLDQRPAVEREWLSWVNTGLAMAIIRAALSKQSESKKTRIGKELLQEVFTKHKHGFIDELRLESIRYAIRALGYTSVTKAYIAIADGHLEPDEVHDSIFENRTRLPLSAPKKRTLRYVFRSDQNLLQSLYRIYDKYNVQITVLRIRKNRILDHSSVKVTMEITSDQERAIASELKAIGVSESLFSPEESLFRYVSGVLLLIALWGLDPVVGYTIIHAHSVSANDLTFLRFFTLAIISIGLYLWQRKRSPIPEAPLSLKNSSLWLSAIMLFGIAFFTYTSLQTTSPSHYTIPMTAAGMLITSLVTRCRFSLLVATWTLLIIGMGSLIYLTPEWSLTGIITTMLAVICFGVFSVVSEKYKKQEQVSARSAQYFLVLSVLCLIGSLSLLPFTNILAHSKIAITEMVAFSFVFAGFPYYLYYFYLTHRGIQFVLRTSFLLIFATLFGQAAIMGVASIPLRATLVSGAFVAIGAILPLMCSEARNGKRS